MKFNVIEGSYADFDSIKEDFVQDYLFSFDLSNNEIRIKYGLTHGEFEELSKIVKSEYGYSRRPKKQIKGKYYYRTSNGFIIMKRIGDAQQYLGFVPSEEIAKKCVELCKRASWNVTLCKHLIKHWREFCA